MADDTEKKECKNPTCTCPPQPGGKYCSASCEGTGKTIELDCDCGHPECGGNFNVGLGALVLGLWSWFRIDLRGLTALNKQSKT